LILRFEGVAFSGLALLKLKREAGFLVLLRPLLAKRETFGGYLWSLAEREAGEA
jgi:hypothetical protein